MSGDRKDNKKPVLCRYCVPGWKRGRNQCTRCDGWRHPIRRHARKEHRDKQAKVNEKKEQRS